MPNVCHWLTWPFQMTITYFHIWECQVALWYSLIIRWCCRNILLGICGGNIIDMQLNWGASILMVCILLHRVRRLIIFYLSRLFLISWSKGCMLISTIFPKSIYNFNPRYFMHSGIHWNRRAETTNENMPMRQAQPPTYAN